MELKRWEDLDANLLWRILTSFEDISDSESAVAMVHCSAVCKEWSSILCDPLLWTKLDLSTMKSNYIDSSVPPYVYVHSQSDAKLNRVLKVSLSLSRGCLTTLIFGLELYVPDDLLTYVAERSPRLKRLVMPVWNRIKKTGMCNAISCWKELESLTIPNMRDPECYFKEISSNCKNIRELKIMDACYKLDMMRRRCPNCLALKLVEYLPNLEVLSLRCSWLLKDGLITILDGLQYMKVLNISHCVVLNEIPLPDEPLGILTELDPVIAEKASRLQRFITCIPEQDSCIMCRRTKTDEGMMRWRQYGEGLWKKDEVESLDL